MPLHWPDLTLPPINLWNAPHQEPPMPEPITHRWHLRFLQLAQHVAGWSKDPSTQVGACLVRPNRTVLSLGYNGLPRGVADRDELLADRDYKYARTVHAEMNAILSAPERPAGCTLYVRPMPPCSSCAASIIQAGIARVVATAPEERWLHSCTIGDELLREAGVSTHWLAGHYVQEVATP